MLQSDVTDSTWYDNGPPLTYVPVPIPDPRRPWGGDCNNCAGFCAEHFLRPEEHKDYVEEFGVGGCMVKPPSVIIQQAFYNLIKNDDVLSDSHVQEVAKRTQLSVEELNMHVDNLRLMAQRRKEGAEKEACTKAKKKSGKYGFCIHVIVIKQNTHFNSIRT